MLWVYSANPKVSGHGSGGPGGNPAGGPIGRRLANSMAKQVVFYRPASRSNERIPVHRWRQWLGHASDTYLDVTGSRGKIRFGPLQPVAMLPPP
jgi:hypothetical protein